jgi:hypothetical protein
MNRLVKSMLAVAAIASVGLAAMPGADAQRIGTQKWAGDAETLVHNATQVVIECTGCSWHGAQCTDRAKNYRTCDHRCVRPQCPNDKRWDNCSERCIPLARPAPPPGQRPGGSAGPPAPNVQPQYVPPQPQRPAQPQYVPPQPPCPPGKILTRFGHCWGPGDNPCPLGYLLGVNAQGGQSCVEDGRCRPGNVRSSTGGCVPGCRPGHVRISTGQCVPG